MIRIIDGPLGSGKTYFVVNYLTRFAQWEPLYQEWMLKEQILIITNIDGLKIKHLQLDELIKKYGFKTFFSKDNFEKVRQHYHTQQIIMIIDEAQEYFPKDFKDRDVCFLFEWSRHLGLDIILITQHANKISRELVPLCEGIVKALPRSQSMPGVLRYVHCDTKYNENYKTQLRTKKEIFAAYKSFNQTGVEKPKSIYIKVFTISIIALFISIGSISLFFKGLKGGVSHASNRSNVSKPNPPVPAHPPVFAPHTSNHLLHPASSSMFAKADNSLPLLPGIDHQGSPGRSAVKVRIDGFIETNGKVKYYLINGQIVKPSRIFAYNREEGTGYFIDDGVSPALPAALAGATARQQPGPVVPDPALLLAEGKKP